MWNVAHPITPSSEGRNAFNPRPKAAIENVCSASCKREPVAAELPRKRR